MAAAVCLAATPATAFAAPSTPSNGEVSAAQATADHLAAQVGAMLTDLGAARSAVEAADARAARRPAAVGAGPATADEAHAAAAGRRPRGAAGAGRPRRRAGRPRRVRPRQLHGRLHLARSWRALITSGQPGADAGAGRAARRLRETTAPPSSAAVTVARAAGRQSSRAAAQGAVAEADRLTAGGRGRPAASAAGRAGCRAQQAADLQAAQAAMQAQLDQARTSLVALQRQRTAAQQAPVATRRPAAAQPRRRPPPTPSGAGSDRPAGPAPAFRGHDWDAVAQCESGGNWSINTGNGYYGGLQFSVVHLAGVRRRRLRRRGPTWPRRSQQIAIAEKVLAAQGPGAWPICGRNL